MTLEEIERLEAIAARLLDHAKDLLEVARKERILLKQREGRPGLSEAFERLFTPTDEAEEMLKLPPIVRD